MDSAPKIVIVLDWAAHRIWLRMHESCISRPLHAAIYQQCIKYYCLLFPSFLNDQLTTALAYMHHLMLLSATLYCLLLNGRIKSIVFTRAVTHTLFDFLPRSANEGTGKSPCPSIRIPRISGGTLHTLFIWVNSACSPDIQNSASSSCNSLSCEYIN